MTDLFDDDLAADGPTAEQVEAERSASRRADPIAAVAELVDALFAQNTLEEAYDEWARRAVVAPAFVHDMLACLDAVVADPPPDLAQRLRADADLHLYHDDATAYDDAEVRAWLADTAAAFRAMLPDTDDAEPGDELDESDADDPEDLW